VPAYRAYTVDSLKKLSFLDDLLITVDERLLYNGISEERCELVVMTAGLQATISSAISAVNSCEHLLVVAAKCRLLLQAIALVYGENNEFWSRLFVLLEGI